MASLKKDCPCRYRSPEEVAKAAGYFVAHRMAGGAGGILAHLDDWDMPVAVTGAVRTIAQRACYRKKGK